MTTASIVARSGWIIPEPFAIPPTVKPPRETTASFERGVGGHDRLGRVGAAVVGERRRRRARAPGSSLCSGSRAPITPVESTSTSSEVEVEQPRRLGGRRERVELAALAGRGVRDARVDHDRLRLGEREMLAVHLQARGLDAGCA